MFVQGLILVVTGALFVGAIIAVIYFYTAKRVIGSPISLGSAFHAAILGWIATALVMLTLGNVAPRFQVSPFLSVPVAFALIFLCASLVNASLIRRADGKVITFSEGMKLHILPMTLLIAYSLSTYRFD